MLGIGHTPFEVTADLHHLGSEPTCVHYCTAVYEGGGWWIFDGGMPPVKFEVVLLVEPEICMSHGEAGPFSLLAEEFFILSSEEGVNHIIHEPTTLKNGTTWFQALDPFSVGIQVFILYPVLDLSRNTSCAGAGSVTSTSAWKWPIELFGMNPSPGRKVCG